MVHKLVSTGTIEEKIDTVLSGKNKLAEQVLGKGTGKWITELDDTELLNMMRLTF
jgi:non-specific serine/threonine protein kinase